MSRTASIERTTKETAIRLSLDLDGSGRSDIRTSIPFLDHMLEQIARHGLVDLTIEAKGDREIDDHHTVEDIGICLGEALRDALGDKQGITRYGHAYVPLDEALARALATDLMRHPQSAIDALARAAHVLGKRLVFEMRDRVQQKPRQAARKKPAARTRVTRKSPAAAPARKTSRA